MSCHQAQIVTNTILGEFDQRIWDSLALKVIDKMPRIVNTKEISHNMSQFVFMNSSLQATMSQIPEENQQERSKIIESYMMGSADVVKKQAKRTSIPRLSTNLADKRLKKLPSKLFTEGAQPVSTMQSHTNSTYFPLFNSEDKSQEQERKDDILRISKNQQAKFNQREEFESRERRIASEQRLMAQRKKFKEVKRFTYDYEGKIMNVAEKKGQQTKVFNIKSFFKSNLAQHRQKQSKNNSIDPSKAATVSTKKVISMEHRRQDEQSLSASYLRIGKTAPINLIQMFKGDQKVELGVSITDVMQNSTLTGGKRKKLGNQSMQLSQFKQKNSTLFKPRLKTEQLIERKKALSEVKAVSQKKAQLDRQSEIESKRLSSTISLIAQKMGRINKNEDLYTENFSNQ